MQACVIGATGLVGTALVRQLLDDSAFDSITVLSRRALPSLADVPRLTQHLVDFDRIDALQWPHSDILFCCLGTTIKTAGSQDAFRKVDFDYVIQSARAALQAGTRTLVVVSALGANADSPVFYNRVKGEMETAVSTLGFDRLVIVRPSLLAGERSERRPGEHLALNVLKIVGWLVPLKYRPVAATTVARAMIRLAKDNLPGKRIIESDQLQRLA